MKESGKNQRRSVIWDMSTEAPKKRKEGKGEEGHGWMNGDVKYCKIWHENYKTCGEPYFLVKPTKRRRFRRGGKTLEREIARVREVSYPTKRCLDRVGGKVGRERVMDPTWIFLPFSRPKYARLKKGGGKEVPVGCLQIRLIQDIRGLKRGCVRGLMLKGSPRKSYLLVNRWRKIKNKCTVGKKNYMRRRCRGGVEKDGGKAGMGSTKLKIP